MAQTYLLVQKQIQTLQREAEKLRMQEMSGVINRIKVAIAEYGITAEQLGLGSASRRAIVKNPGKASGAGKAKYANAQGQVWGGMGPRPAWLRAELEAGKSLEDFLVKRGPAKAKPASTRVPKGVLKRRARTQYADPASGKTWAGMGPRPMWLKDLVASGKTLEEFTV
ncbi:H-NS family nucleoid-associated regulatory protein [Variovorax sp. GT1P44]|uniref:H-NS family nucleoid-associated regulatory protein n=1 Tax=Variovorax sp. GT1P44 TaxID=3443742 RepID=UPI003F4578E2